MDVHHPLSWGHIKNDFQSGKNKKNLHNTVQPGYLLYIGDLYNPIYIYIVIVVRISHSIPSNIEWDRIPTDPYTSKLRGRAIRY